MKDIANVWLHNGVVLAVATLDFESMLKIALLAVSLAYTLWKWRRDIKRKQPED